MQSIDTIRLSEKQKQQLMVLKRKTGIENWNVLCRWALCLSLADSTMPPKEGIPSDSNVEMTWKVFTGDQYNIYSAIIAQSFFMSNFDNLNDFFKCHLSRGIHILTKSDLIS